MSSLISYIHHTCEYQTVLSCGKHCHNNADWVCFKTHTLRATLRTLNQPQEVSCVFGSRTFVPVSWMCKKQTAVSHSSTESEIISGCWITYGWVTCSRSFGTWWLKCYVQTNNKTQTKHTSHQETGAVLDSKTKTQHVTRRQKVDQLSEVDYVSTNTHSSQGESQLYIFEDNEAVIKMIIKGRNPTMRHVSRTHRSCSWLVLWQNQFGTQNPNQIQLTPKTNSLTFWPKEVSRKWMESPAVFVQSNELLDVFL